MSEKPFIPKIDKNLENYKDNLLEESSYPYLLEILGIDRIPHKEKVPRFEGLILDNRRKFMFYEGKRITLGNVEKAIMWILIRKNGEAIATSKLVEALELINPKSDNPGYVAYATGVPFKELSNPDNSLRVTISRLKRKIHYITNGKLSLVSERHRGYWLIKNS